MIDANTHPLPAWHGVRTLSKMVSKMQFQGRLDTCGTTPCPKTSQDWVLGFSNDTTSVVALWSVGSGPRVIELHFAFGTWSQFDWLGNYLGTVVAPSNRGHVKLYMNSTCGDIYADIDTVEQCAPIYLVQQRGSGSVLPKPRQ